MEGQARWQPLLVSTGMLMVGMHGVVEQVVDSEKPAGVFCR